MKRTEHYVNVGKSKLRDHSVNLKDPKYTGKTSSRKDIFENTEIGSKIISGVNNNK